ncbi:MAG TPA: hypothetical protein VMT72_12625 [Pseudolabrys sp.]|nr:hypothetical protein [Pseudolabrys sp.]
MVVPASTLTLSDLTFRQISASRQKLPLAGSKSNFRLIPENGLNSAIAACPKCADCVEEVGGPTVWDVAGNPARVSLVAFWLALGRATG